MLLRDPSRNYFYLRWISPPINLVELLALGWPFYKLPELDASNKNSKEYKVEVIWNSAFYTKESEDHLLDFDYLVTRKNYLKKENTW